MLLSALTQLRSARTDLTPEGRESLTLGSEGQLRATCQRKPTIIRRKTLSFRGAAFGCFWPVLYPVHTQNTHRYRSGTIISSQQRSPQESHRDGTAGLGIVNCPVCPGRQSLHPARHVGRHSSGRATFSAGKDSNSLPLHETSRQRPFSIYASEQNPCHLISNTPIRMVERLGPAAERHGLEQHANTMIIGVER